MMGPGFGDAVGAMMVAKLLKFVVLPVAAICLVAGLLIGWLL